jgi:hypothetical protein
MLSAVTTSSGKKTEGSRCGLFRGTVENYNKMWKEAAMASPEGLQTTTTKTAMVDLKGVWKTTSKMWKEAAVASLE